jgi:hypothetical protein
MKAAHGGRYLRVCFSEPETLKQPIIAPDGTDTDTTFGCANSARIGPLPKLKLRNYLRFPANRRCLMRDRLRLHIHNPTNDPVAHAVVALKSGAVRRRASNKRKGAAIIATLNLVGLPPGRFMVSVHLRTVLGKKFDAKHFYTRCVKRKRRGKHAQRHRPA